MTRSVVGDDRSQSTLFFEQLDDYLGEDNPVRAVDLFVDELDLAGLGFGGVEPEATGRPAYHPTTLFRIYVCGYLNRVQSSRRLERECQRNCRSRHRGDHYRSKSNAPDRLQCPSGSFSWPPVARYQGDALWKDFSYVGRGTGFTS